MGKSASLLRNESSVLQCQCCTRFFKANLKYFWESICGEWPTRIQFLNSQEWKLLEYFKFSHRTGQPVSRSVWDKGMMLNGEVLVRFCLLRVLHDIFQKVIKKLYWIPRSGCSWCRSAMLVPSRWAPNHLLHHFIASSKWGIGNAYWRPAQTVPSMKCCSSRTAP